MKKTIRCKESGSQKQEILLEHILLHIHTPALTNEQGKSEISSVIPHSKPNDFPIRLFYFLKINIGMKHAIKSK